MDLICLEQARERARERARGLAVIPPPLLTAERLTGTSACLGPVSHSDEAGRNVLSEIPPPPPPPPAVPLTAAYRSD